MRNLILFLAVIAAACAPSKTSTPAAEKPAEKKVAPPDAAAAATLISNSSDFSDYQFTNASYTLPMRAADRRNPEADDAAKQLKAAGWLSLDGDGNVVLTGKAKDDKRFLVRPNQTVDIVPLAKKEFGTVTAVRPNADGTVAADFTWKWVPNDVGQSFRTGTLADRYAGEQKATAKLMQSGESWTVLSISPAT